MKNILAIGNSFSEDAARYLHQMAEAAGIETKVVNLYIGGCPLERHWQNIETGEAAYQYQLNGKATERMVSIDEVLREGKWDYVITQQASHDSGWMDTYEPFLGLMLDHLKEHLKQSSPQAEILLQETWAYEIGSSHANFMRYNWNQEEMYARLKRCYSAMAEFTLMATNDWKLEADGISLGIFHGTDSAVRLKQAGLPEGKARMLKASSRLWLPEEKKVRLLVVCRKPAALLVDGRTVVKSDLFYFYVVNPANHFAAEIDCVLTGMD